ncbi:hypothetical protein ACFX13_003920 [Malus domestica]
MILSNNINNVASIVCYGKLRYPPTHEATGYSLVYNQLYPFEVQNYTSGIIHHVRLTRLKLNTLYFYRCGDPSIHAMSQIHHFRTMPVSGPRSYPERIAVMGDLGLTYNTTTTLSHLKSNNPDLVLLIGNVTYANLYLTNGTGSDRYSCSFPNSPIHETYQPRWDYWGWYMQSLVSKVPIMVVEGNHEIEEQAENKTFEAYSSLPFSSDPKHVHAYKRSNRDYDYNLDSCGPVYLTVGDGGNREKMAVQHADEPGHCPEPSTTPDQHLGVGAFCVENFTSGPAAGKFCWDRQPNYSAFRESSFGHGILEVLLFVFFLFGIYPV